MKTAIIALVALLIGAIIGGIASLGFGVGVGAASGLIMGSQAGACLAVEAAKAQGLIPVGAADRVIAATVEQIKNRAHNVPDDAKIKWISGEADCANMISEMDRGTAKAQ
jgi:hypothetical protein